MIKKVIKVANVGKFEDYTATGDVEFRKVNLVYGENGLGKTTLSSILHSLKLNEPAYILERVTVGSKSDASVNLLLETGNAIFGSGAWNNSLPKIEIFDSTFINQNVFSGEDIDHDHKKNLYRFAVGEQGVQYAEKVNELDAQIRIKNTEISNKEQLIAAHILGPTMTVQDFLELANVPDIEQVIIDQKTKIETINKASTIVNKSELQRLLIPDLPLDATTKLLEKQLKDIAVDAEQRTKNHIQSCMDAQGNSWVQNGLMYLKNDICPFCGQTCDETSLIQSYQSYFNTAYVELKKEIEQQRSSLAVLLSDSSFMRLEQVHRNNEFVAEFWRQYIFTEFPQISFEDAETTYTNARTELLDLLDEKLHSPLEKIEVSGKCSQAVQIYDSLKDEITIYNQKVDQINGLINSKKVSAGGGNVVAAQNELQRLENIAKRHTPQIDILCKEYKALVQEKKSLDREKKSAKKDLDEYVDSLFAQYGTVINNYLADFGAGFKIVQLKTSYSGGRPSTSYFIELNQSVLDLGDMDTFGRPCFRNLLSNGDKNALAFAFFLAKLDQDSDLAEKVVVFDDPITSLDRHRKTMTQQQILSIAQKAKQTIVLSHDLHFLRSLWDSLPSGQVKTLVMNRSANGTVIGEWDIAIDTQGEYFRDHAKLFEFVNKGSSDDLRAIARCIRPVLEGYLRIKFPGQFLPNEWLGDFIVKVEKATSTDPAYTLQSALGDLKSINEYSKQYHHSNITLIPNPIEQELRTFAQKTLDFIKQ